MLKQQLILSIPNCILKATSKCNQGFGTWFGRVFQSLLWDGAFGFDVTTGSFENLDILLMKLFQQPIRVIELVLHFKNWLVAVSDQNRTWGLKKNNSVQNIAQKNSPYTFWDHIDVWMKTVMNCPGPNAWLKKLIFCKMIFLICPFRLLLPILPMRKWKWRCVTKRFVRTVPTDGSLQW